jgi:hypothetical protein
MTGIEEIIEQAKPKKNMMYEDTKSKLDTRNNSVSKHLKSKIL